MRTSVHYASGMHVVQRATDLDEILPDGSLRNLALLFLEMLQRCRVSTSYNDNNK